jgi:glycosyltransferase involved in cell wall biosynthesis
MLCICPTYGRRKELLENMLACYVNQTHKDKELVIYDDSGILNDCVCNVEGVHIMATSKRAESLSNKYNEMFDFAVNKGIEFEGVAIWDDDDVYLPKHLEAHSKALEKYRWSKPSRIISAYLNPPVEEDASGRFYGSIAIRKRILDYLKWPQDKRIDYDQVFMSMLNKVDRPGDTLEFFPIQYVYRWGTTKSSHCSGIAGDSNWYDNYKGDSRDSIYSLEPNFDLDTKRIFGVVNYER